MIPLDTSMPTYDPPLSAWPGIISLAVGLLILVYLITRITRDYRRARAPQNAALASQADANDTPDEPAP